MILLLVVSNCKLYIRVSSHYNRHRSLHHGYRRKYKRRARNCIEINGKYEDDETVVSYHINYA